MVASRGLAGAMKQATRHELLADHCLDLVSEARALQVSLLFQVPAKLRLADLAGDIAQDLRSVADVDGETISLHDIL